MSEKDFRILVVDDDLSYAETCSKAIAQAGYNVTPFGSAGEALQEIKADKTISLVLTDLKMPNRDGIEFLKEIKAVDSAIEVIIMTGYGTIESAVQAIREKATDYITKPFNKNKLLHAIRKICKVWNLQEEIKQLKQIVRGKLHLDGFIFKHELMAKVYGRITSAAGCDCSVFITGESGTGKDMIAKAIHRNSDRSAGPFVAVNCSAFSRELIESELFGYRKGAFTGADRDYDGLFVAADKGTLFFDEIVEMQPGTQAKLLRAIQEKSVRPVGSVDERNVDVRFIAATNTDLKRALSKRQLREDLYYRLNVIHIEIPPLRRMREEIPELLTHILEAKNQKDQQVIRRFDENALKLLKSYTWPGNIREVENIIERLLAEGESGLIRINDLPSHIKDIDKSRSEKEEKVPSFSAAERDLVMRALKEAKGNKSRAAEILGISRPRLYKKIEIYNISEV